MPHRLAIAKLPIARNSLWNAGAYGVGILVLLVAIPFYTRLLGLDRFGLFTLLASLTAPLGVFNVGIAQATTKYVAEFSSANDPEKSVRLFRMTMLFNLTIGVVGCLALWCGASWIATHGFAISAPLIGEAEDAFKLTGAIWLLNQIAATFQAVFIGLQRFRAIAIGQTLQQLVTFGGGVGVLHVQPHLRFLLLWNLLVGLGAVVGWHFATRRYFAPHRLWPAWDEASARLSLRFSAWQFLNSFVGMMANHADRFLLGVLTNIASVGVFGIAVNVQNRLVGLVWSLLGALFPATSSLSRIAGAGEHFILTKGWLISAAGGWLYATLFVLGHGLLSWWVGPELGTRVAPILLLLLGAALVALPSAVVYQYLLGMGLTKLSSMGNLATSVVTVTASLVCIRKYGLHGAAWGTLVGLILTRPLFHLWVFKRHFSPVFRITSCFTLLYGVIASATAAGAIAYLVHQSMTKVFGENFGLLLSCLITPLTVGALMLSLECHALGHSALVADLLAQAKKWLVLAPQPGKVGRPSELIERLK